MDKSLLLKEIKKYLGFKNDYDFAKYLGIARTTLASWYQRNTFDANLIVSKCDIIDANWLLTGKGSMLKADNSKNSQIISGDGNTMAGNNSQIGGSNEAQQIIKNLKNDISSLNKKLAEKDNQINKLINLLSKNGK